MGYSELQEGRLKFDDEVSGDSYIIAQRNDELLYLDNAGNLLQILSNVKSGTKANRPSAEFKGRIYFATDTGEWFYDDGSAWHRIACGGDFIGDADLDTKFETERSADEDIIRAKAGGQDIFEGYSSGIFSLVKQSHVSVKRTTSQTIADSTWTKIQLDTVDHDEQNEFDTTNYRFTATKGGVYIVSLRTKWSTPTSGYLYQAIRKNGNEITASLTTFNYDAGFRLLACTISIKLNAGDYLEGYVQQTSGGDLNLQDAYMTIIKVA